MMAQERLPDAVGVTSKKGNVTTVFLSSPSCYFKPDTEELVFVASKLAGDFENHWRGLEVKMDLFHRACGDYLKAMDDYGVRSAGAMGMAPMVHDKLSREIRSAETVRDEARHAILSEVGEFSQLGMRYGDVVELIPLDKHARFPSVATYAYVTKEYFESNREFGLQSVPLSRLTGVAELQSLYCKGERGIRIDRALLALQLSALDWSRVRADLENIVKEGSVDIRSDPLKFEAILYDWADKWNGSLDKSGVSDGNVDVSAAAQFMRFASNISARVRFDGNQDITALNAEGDISLTLASGVGELTLYLPDRLGWSLSFSDLQGKPHDLGMFRVVLTPALHGYVGASVVIEAQGQIVTKGDQQILAGLPNGKMPSFYQRRKRGIRFDNKENIQDKNFEILEGAFAGVRVEGSFKGSFQWMKPYGPMASDDFARALKLAPSEYVSFCTVSANIAGLAGLGAGSSFQCSYINGKFCVYAAAYLCWGIGAKGGIVGEVEANTIVEFGTWLVTQLYWSNFRFFEVVTGEAFKVYTRYSVRRYIDFFSSAAEVYRSLGDDLSAVREGMEEFVSAIVDEGRESIEASRMRNELARNVSASPDQLLLCTPEAKGLMLYLLTRHDTWDILESGNRGGKAGVDIYGDRKDAVIHVLNSIQTRAEWHKVMVRITRDGESMAGDDNERSVSERQQRFLVDFLRIGFNRDEDLYKARRELIAIKVRLKLRPARGYAMAMNNTYYYALNHRDHLGWRVV